MGAAAGILAACLKSGDHSVHLEIFSNMYVLLFSDPVTVKGSLAYIVDKGGRPSVTPCSHRSGPSSKLGTFVLFHCLQEGGGALGGCLEDHEACACVCGLETIALYVFIWVCV